MMRVAICLGRFLRLTKPFGLVRGQPELAPSRDCFGETIYSHDAQLFAICSLHGGNMLVASWPSHQ